MPALRDFSDSVAVIVSSCDAFFDCWQPFAFFFREFWSNCPFDVSLITNELAPDSLGLPGVSVGPDRGWATNLKTVLEKMAQPYLLYFQDDYFLTAPVNENQLAQDFADAIALQADSLCFRAQSLPERNFQPLNKRFGVVPRDSDYRTRLQVAFWKRTSLLAILREGENAWEMESLGSERTRAMKILSYHRRENAPIRYLMSAIVRGLWTPAALELCRENGIVIEPKFRGTYTANSLLRRLRRFQTRRRLALELASRK